MDIQFTEEGGGEEGGGGGGGLKKGEKKTENWYGVLLLGVKFDCIYGGPNPGRPVLVTVIRPIGRIA